MKLHGAILVCLVCGTLAASVPFESKPSELDKLTKYRRALLEFNWRIDESKHILNGNLRGLLESCKDGVDIPALEEKIQHLRSTYASQIAEYRNTLDSLYNCDVDPQLKFGEDHKQIIEANLRKAEANFENGLNKLTSSLEKLKLGAVSLKADGDSSSSTSWWSSIYNFFASYFPDISSSEYVQNVQNTVSSLANNVTALFNQNQGTQVITNVLGGGSDGSSSPDNSGSDSSNSNTSDNSGSDSSNNSGSDNSGSDNSGSGSSDNSDSDNYAPSSAGSDNVDSDRLVNKVPEAPSQELQQNSSEPQPEH